jgi:hypothetical protein
LFWFSKTYLGETALTILADKIGTGSRYPAPVGGASILSIVGHNGEHFWQIWVFFWALFVRKKMPISSPFSDNFFFPSV